MSVVIIGGNDRMVCQYKQICKSYKCKAKVFTQMEGDIKDRIGNPELLILFTNVVSHKMINAAVQKAKTCNACVVRSHSCSSCALKNILENHFCDKKKPCCGKGAACCCKNEGPPKQFVEIEYDENFS